MAEDDLEVLLTAGMLLLMPVIATYYWRDNRAISWGALGLCLLIPEAASERPDASVLHTIMVTTALAVVLQLMIDALKERRQAPDDAGRRAASPEEGDEATPGPAPDARAPAVPPELAPPYAPTLQVRHGPAGEPPAAPWSARPGHRQWRP